MSNGSKISFVYKEIENEAQVILNISDNIDNILEKIKANVSMLRTSEIWASSSQENYKKKINNLCDETENLSQELSNSSNYLKSYVDSNRKIEENIKNGL